MTGKEAIEKGLEIYQRLETMKPGPLARAVQALTDEEIKLIHFTGEHITDLARVAAIMRIAHVKAEDMTDEFVEEGFAAYRKQQGIES